MLAEIAAIGKTWVVPEIFINRAFVFSEILEYCGLSGVVSLNKDKKIQFEVKIGKKNLIIILDSVSWIVYNIGKEKGEILHNKRNLIEFLKELKNEYKME